MKICFLAPSGYGKSTGVSLLSKHYNLKCVKIAEPLYEFQKYFYDMLGIDIHGKQDGELLQFLGVKIRKEKPMYLLETFYNKVNLLKGENLVIVNDDCRCFDYEFLKSMGFIFIKINGFSRERNDHTKIDKGNILEWKDEILFDYEVCNLGSICEYEENLINLMREIENDKKVLCYSSRKNV